MKKALLVCLIFSASCTDVSTPQNLKNFQDLLQITDTTNTPICNLPLTDLRANLTVDEIEAAKIAAFDYQPLVEKYADDPAQQIRVIFRRAALKRRLNVVEDRPDLAQKYYDDLSAYETTPSTLYDFHEAYHYWMERIDEQGDYGEANLAEYNLRFCVMNEKRAELHAASRKDILARVKRGVSLPAAELIENINHETTFENEFSSKLLSEIFTDEAIAALTPLERAQLRGDQAFLPTDPKTEELFWDHRNRELSAMIAYIGSHEYATPADKLGDMTDIDQSMRKVWQEAESAAHFENPDQHRAFRENIGKRMGDSVVNVDEFNTAELQNMLKGRGWFRDDIDGQGAAHDAWLIAQHADRNPNFQQEALKLIEAELGAPGVSKSNYAYLYDRVQMRFGDRDNAQALQRYATQGRCTGPGTWEPLPFENPDKIDATRAEVGLGSLAEYKARFKTLCTEDQR